jgi:hypothetical protein
MTRSTRIAVFSGALLVLVAGTALGTQTLRPTPQGPLTASHEEQPDEPPTADELANANDRLAASGINASTDQLSNLAADYGLGGAVRLFAWADQTGISIADLRARHDAGEGWGQIAKDLGVSPGIGSVMGNGGGHGRDNAPGQQKNQPEGEPE